MSTPNSAIHPADEMLKISRLAFSGDDTKARAFYHNSGLLIAGQLIDTLKGRGLDPEQLRLLEFACGYGRVTRHLVGAFKDITVSDLEPDMLQFVREIAGAEGFLSNVDLAQVKWPALKFDVVFSYSLFTHLHPEIWRGWFDAVFDCVAPGGLMIFTTRGPDFAKRTGEKIEEGETVRFTKQNETEGRLDASVYGRTTASVEFVDVAIAQNPSAVRSGYIKEFDKYQDMHIVSRVSGER